MKKILYFFALLFSMALSAQDGTLDTSFNPMDMGINSGFNKAVTDMKLLPNGKMLIAGVFNTYQSTNVGSIVRLNADCSLDSTFKYLSSAYGVSAIALQSDDRILIGGSGLRRLNADGSIDNTFVANYNITIYSIVVQNDGKILIGGNFTSYNGVSINNFARLNQDGSLDTTFNIGTGLNNVINSVLIQSDGKIIVGGNFSTFNNIAKSNIVRLNSDGSIDTTFEIGNGFSGSVYGSNVVRMILGQDEKILVYGTFNKYNGYTTKQLIRLNQNGSLDETFVPATGSYLLALQSDGKIFTSSYSTVYVGGNSTTVYGIGRLNSDGSLDTTFQSKIVGGALPGTILSMPDGKIIIGGGFTSYDSAPRNYIARLESNGNLDKTIFIQTGLDGQLSNLYKYYDGNIIMTGSFKYYNEYAKSGIIRISPDGNMDTSFKVTYPGKPQEDGKFIVTGTTSIYQDNIGRLNPDGTMDLTFVPGTKYHYTYNMKAFPQPDNKVLINYMFTSNGGPSGGGSFERLTANGILDTTFKINSAKTVYFSTTLTNGKIITGGIYDSNGLLKNIAMLKSDGNIDNSFVSTANGNVYSVFVQKDEKILVVGDFTLFNGVSFNRISRINPDGTLDGTFNPGLGANGIIYSVIVQEDGKILIAGTFTTYNGAPASRIAKLNSDGSLDTTFSSGTGFNDVVNTLLLQPDGKVLVGGNFTSYNGAGKNRIVRLNNTVVLSTTDISKNKQIVIYPNPVKDILNIKSDEPISGYEIYSLDGRKLTTGNKVNDSKIDVSQLQKGNYLLKVKTKDKEQTTKFIKE